MLAKTKYFFIVKVEKKLKTRKSKVVKINKISSREKENFVFELSTTKNDLLGLKTSRLSDD
jgi:hypothetical protein